LAGSFVGRNKANAARHAAAGCIQVSSSVLSILQTSPFRRSVMRMLLVSSLAALLTVAAGGVFAQPFGGGLMRSNAMLLNQESVRKELKLRYEQVKKAQELGEKMREKFQELQGLEGE